MIIDARTPVTINGYTFDAETWAEYHAELLDQIVAITRGLA